MNAQRNQICHFIGTEPAPEFQMMNLEKIRGADTQEEFARALHISQAQLSKYELGQSALPLSLVVKLAERSGRTTDWILTGKS